MAALFDRHTTGHEDFLFRIARYKHLPLSHSWLGLGILTEQLPVTMETGGATNDTIRQRWSQFC